MSPLQRLELEAHQRTCAERRLHADLAWRYRLRRIEQDDLLPEELALPERIGPDWSGFDWPDGIDAAEAAALDLPA